MMKMAFEKNAKLKSMSLPPGVNPKVLQEHAYTSSSTTKAEEKHSSHHSAVTATTSATNITTASSSSTTTTSVTSTSIYSNHKISKSHDFGKEKSAIATPISEKSHHHEEDGFFKKLLHRGNGKKKDTIEETIDKPIEKAEIHSQPEKVERPQKLVIETKPYDAKMSPDGDKFMKSVRSGPAARQRVVPKDLSLSPDTNRRISNELVEKDKLPTVKSPRKSPNALDRSTEFIFAEQHVKTRLYTKSSSVNQSLSRSDELLNSPSDETVTYTNSLSRDGWPLSRMNKKAKIAGLSPFQQRVSEIETPEELSPKRKPVEKSKSFRLYSYNNGSGDNVQMNHNLPSLPDLSNTDKFGGSPVKSPDSTNLTLKFEINDNNLIKSRDDLSRSYMFTKDVKPGITVSSNPPSSLSNNNISQIEENIDKLVKGSFVTVLKKSPSTEIAPEVKVKANVSITNITAAPVEIKKKEEKSKEEKLKEEKLREEKLKEEKNIQSSNEEIALRERSDNGNSTLTRSYRISTPAMEISSSASSLSSSTSSVPEFMKIQLNRVDNVRPKSHVVLSKNSREYETLPRRSSNETLDKETTIMKPPLPPDVTTSTLKRMSINKSQETITESNPVIIVPKSPVKKTAEVVLMKKPEIPKKIEVQPIVPLIQRKPSFEASHHNSRKPSIERVSSRDEFKDGNNNVRQILLERRRSVSDEKAKIERRISVSDESKLNERKKSFEGSNLRKTSSSDDENVVIMRKKSLSSNGSSREDNTPELMKVFARRSLKIKDPEDESKHEEKTNDSNKKFNLNVNLDSDKENQSSSEEKLDRISAKPPEPKTITLTKIPVFETSKGVDVIIEKNREIPKMDSVIPLRKTSGSSANLQGPKPFGITPNRFSSNLNYRNSASFLDIKKNLMQTSPGIPVPVTTILDKVQKSNLINNNTITAPSKISNDTHVKNGNVLNNNTIIMESNGNSIMVQDEYQLGSVAEVQTETQLPEFKGILERRAEWEKRAKAFK